MPAEAAPRESRMVGKDALGKYRLLRPIGSGANAAVFLASPLNYPNQRVVVKRIHDHIAAHPKFRQLFEAEVRSMANFCHPYTVRLIDWSCDDPLGPCLVMEYVPGTTLEVVLARHRKMPLERVGRLLGYMCHALQAAHEAGIIHRDLKPANLMVVNAGQPNESLKVMDFGFASFAAQPHLQLADLTGQGPVYAIGTPGYVSPEMIRGDRVDGRSDLYSVGIILYEMVTGQMPFHRETQEGLLEAHVYELPPRFREIGCTDTPDGVESVVQLALSKYPIERQQTARDVAVGFGQALSEKFWEETTPAGWEPNNRDVVYRMPPQHTPPKIQSDPFGVVRDFEVAIPERLAAAKLRGFVEDFGGEVVASEPGLILMRLGVKERPQEKKPVPGSTGLFSWLGVRRQPAPAAPPPGSEPVEVELHMEKPDPTLTNLKVSVECRPSREHPPHDLGNFRERCQTIHTMLRKYLGA